MECPICLCSTNNKFIKTPCKHYFHEECLKEWYVDVSKLQQLYNSLQNNKRADVRQIVTILGTNWNEILNDLTK